MRSLRRELMMLSQRKDIYSKSLTPLRLDTWMYEAPALVSVI